MGLIGTLATVLIVVINPRAQIQRANDGKRKSEIKQLQAAFELYRSDNGRYPYFTGYPNSGVAPVGTINLNINGVTYLSSIPTSPSGNNCDGYVITYDSDSYTLFTILENSSDPDATSVKPVPGYVSGSSSDGYKTYTFSAATCTGKTYNYWVNNP